MRGWRIIIDGRRRYEPTETGPRSGVPRIDWASARTVATAVRIERQPVESSSVASVGYDVATSTLEVAYRKSGVYRYFGVPSQTYARVLAAESVGRLINEEVRDIYPYTRM